MDEKLITLSGSSKYEWLKKRFPDEDSILEFIKDLYYPHVVCNIKGCRKEHKKFYKLARGRVYSCGAGHHLSPLAKTPFKKSSLYLWTWMVAIYLLENRGPSMPARLYYSAFNVPYKTAWRMKIQLLPLLFDPLWQPFLNQIQEKTREIAWKEEEARQRKQRAVSGRIGAEVYPLKIREKNPHAVALGRRGGLIGGLNRASKLTPERRREIAIKASHTRWGKVVEKQK